MGNHAIPIQTALQAIAFIVSVDHPHLIVVMDIVILERLSQTAQRTVHLAHLMSEVDGLRQP